MTQNSVDPNRMTPAKWLMVGAFMLFILFFVFVMQRTPNRTSAPAVDITAVKFGMSTAQVRASVGEPSQSQDLQTAGTRTQMWYYTVDDRQVQVVFHNDYVESINRY